MSGTICYLRVVVAHGKLEHGAVAGALATKRRGAVQIAGAVDGQAAPGAHPSLPPRKRYKIDSAQPELALPLEFPPALLELPEPPPYSATSTRTPMTAAIMMTVRVEALMASLSRWPETPASNRPGPRSR